MEEIWPELQVRKWFLISWCWPLTSDLAPSSWRRKCGTQSCAVSRPTTPDNISLSTSTVTLRNLSASRSNFRWSYFGGKENTRGGGRGGGRQYWLLWWLLGESDEPVNSDVDTTPLSNTKYPPTASASSGSPSSASLKSHSSSLLSYKQPYLGWRSQERLKVPSSYLSSPSQRLASSVLSASRLQRIAE